MSRRGGFSVLPLVLGIGGLAAFGLVLAATGTPDPSNSRREGTADYLPAGASRYGRAGVLLSAVGWPYWFGGDPAGVTTWARGALGVDCSLFASLALVALAIRRTFRRYTARSLADACVPIPWGQQRPGDIAIYPGHVMVVLSLPDANGDSEVIGASGGDHTTHGNDPKARVKVFRSARYRDDFVTFGRLKASEAA